ncbi:GspE/PulE family protein [Lignipirellula cremea]|uniref:Type II secretion system protein E n=1 Tax=Lignipirellula cremea TaxID=2528010 RepID=A0A518DU53_9BACT|nr:GspE/PulE family protein [Lignipirellula cremea]QDU95367.1 Type II secretion system protein E [Lignipirellula cremea]
MNDHRPEEAPIDFTATDLADMPIQEAIESIVRQAVSMNSSDLYFLSEELCTSVKVRSLGTISRIAVLSADQGRHILSVMKANAGMDIAERRRPCDGRLLFSEGDLRIDLRINTVPTLFGEDMTCRILDRSSNLRSLDDLGMTRGDLGQVRSMLQSTSGLILVTGPTGTGKTTTQYACLQHLNDGTKKINTIEDPVEYAMSGVCQTGVNLRVGLNFSDILPSLLRQSPDIIMIGEIRDEETAITAVRAANSGHLVLATLHAPVAAGAVQSMLALNSNPYFLASCLLGVIAQRLIRVLCPACRVAYDISMAPETFAEIQHLLDADEGKAIYGPAGCEKCYGRGYGSRMGLYEVLVFNREIRRLVSDARPSREIEQAAIKNGMIEFRRAALLRVAQGVTSTEEMMQEVPSEYLGLED